VISMLGLATGATVLAIRQHQQSEEARDRKVYNVVFPRTSGGDEVTAFLRALATLLGSPGPLSATNAAVLEVLADRQGLHHRVRLPRRIGDQVVSQLRAALPGVLVAADNPVGLGPRWSSAQELRLTRHDAPLRVDHPEAVATAVLAALATIRPPEQVVLQWVLAPAR